MDGQGHGMCHLLAQAIKSQPSLLDFVLCCLKLVAPKVRLAGGLPQLQWASREAMQTFADRKPLQIEFFIRELRVIWAQCCY